MRHGDIETGDGLRLSIRIWEPPPPEPVAVLCLIHGLGEHGGRYNHLAGFLTSKRFLVLALDLRGHGESPGPRGHSPGYDVLIDDIDRFVRLGSSMGRKMPLFLYGHSLGGGIVINYCLKKQPLLAGVIVTGPLLRPAFDPPGWKLALARLIYRLRPTLAMSNELDVTAISRDPKVIEAYRRDPLVHDRLSVALAVEMLAAGQWNLDHAREFPLPLLLMHGGEDRLTSCKASREFALQAGDVCTLKIWPGLYHEIHNEPQQGEVFDYLGKWLRLTVEQRRNTADSLSSRGDAR